MAVNVIMPRQGQSVETCIITQWHKSKGEKVETGDLLFSYETDKAAFEEEAKQDGILLEIFYEEGDEVPVLENVAVIGQEGETIGSAGNTEDADEQTTSGEKENASEDTQKQNVPSEASPSASTADVSDKVDQKIKISPLARKIAGKLGISYNGIKGTGPKGRIIKWDVERAAEAVEKEEYRTSAQSQASWEEKQVKQDVASLGQTIKHTTGKYESTGDHRIEKISNLRKIIASKMHESLQNSAQLTHHLSADARQLLKIRKKYKQRVAENPSNVNVTINDLVCYALIKTLKKHPVMNAHFMGDSLKLFDSVNLGIAVDTERGLMVPALRNANDYNIEGLSRRLKTLAADCRQGNIDPDLLSSEAAGFTVSNLGGFGIEMFTPVLNLPQTGILGVNTITYKPADTGDGTIGFIPHIGLSLTYDHRAVDGAPASAFLQDVKISIETLEI